MKNIPSPLNGAPNRLAPEEVRELKQLEKTIDRYKEDFLQIAKCLRTIQEKRLYRASADTFESYCDKQWGMCRSAAYYYLWALEVIEELEAASKMYSQIYIPRVKSHAYRLYKLDENQRIAVAKQLFEWDKRGDKITNTVVDCIIADLIGTTSASQGELAASGDEATFDGSDLADDSEGVTTDSEAQELDEYASTTTNTRVAHEAASNKLTGDIEDGGGPQMPVGFSIVLPVLEELPPDTVTTPEGHLEPWPADETGMVQRIRAIADTGPDTELTRTSTLSDMAAWTWSPIVSSLYGDTKGLPDAKPLRHAALLPSRLTLAPFNSQPTPSPEASYVVVSPGVDLFDPLVPDIALETVMHYMRQAHTWRFIVLTHCPDRVIIVSTQSPLPENVLIGVVAESAEDVAKTEAVLRQVQGGVPWIYLKKAKAPVVISPTTQVQWIVIEAGGVPYKNVSNLLEWQTGPKIHCRQPLLYQQRAWPSPEAKSTTPARKPRATKATGKRAGQKREPLRFPTAPTDVKP